MAASLNSLTVLTKDVSDDGMGYDVGVRQF